MLESALRLTEHCLSFDSVMSKKEIEFFCAPFKLTLLFPSSLLLCVCHPFLLMPVTRKLLVCSLLFPSCLM